MSEYKKLAETLELAKKEEGLLGKANRLISAPQRYTMNKLAGYIGANGDATDSEKSAQAIVERGADLLNLPDSSVTNALKAAGVAGLEVFADPTNLLPFGKIGEYGLKGLGMLGKILPFAEKANVIEKAVPASLKSLKNLEGAIMQGKIKVSPEIAEKVTQSIAEQTPKNIVEALPEKYETIGTHFIKKEPENFGKVIKVGEAKQYEDAKNALDSKFLEELKKRGNE